MTKQMSRIEKAMKLKHVGAIRIRWRAAVVLAVELVLASVWPMQVAAHGERNQEPFLRMRTAHFYDMKWSVEQTPVNGEITISGKFRLFKTWPGNLPPPEKVFLGNGTPGPVLARVESYINGVPAIQSTSLELDRDYEFKTVLRGRVPGDHHVHPMINVSGAGPLLGPGNWLKVAGDRDDFVLPAKTLSGETIDDLEVWGLGDVYGWNIFWLAVGLGWILWWLRRPLLLPRLRALTEDEGDVSQLVTSLDKKVAAALMVGTILVVFFGYQMAETQYPKTIPLQGSAAVVEPLPVTPEAVKVRVTKSTYDVPGRSLRFTARMTNEGSMPMRLGELLTANLRFVNRAVPQAVAALDPEYPTDLVPRSGLKVSDDQPLMPGETRVVQVEATDAAWETERLAALVNDPDNTMGGLLFFYAEDGTRTISNVTGPMVPTYTEI